MGAKVEGRMAQLEILVDELIKEAPAENRIRTCMEAVGLAYTKDPVTRMNKVLAALDSLRPLRKERDL